MKGKIKTTLLITVLLISTLTIAIPLVSAQDTLNLYEPETETPLTSGPVGTSVDVTPTEPSDITPFGLVEIFWDDLGGSKLGEGYAENDGNFTIEITIPEDHEGDHYVVAKDVSIGGTYYGTFTINPEIVLTPELGLPGDDITVEGTGFAANDEVTILFVSPDPYVLPFDVTPDPAPETSVLGSFEATITVPEVPYESYTIEATDEVPNEDTASFTVSATITLEPEEVSSGTIVDISGIGFSEIPLDKVDVYFDLDDDQNYPDLDDDLLLLEDVSLDKGIFTDSFVVPTVDNAPLEGDLYRVFATDGSDIAYFDLNVTATTQIKLTPTAGAPDSEVTIEGVYFTAIADTEVTVKFGTVPVGTLYTNATGGFKGTFEVPYLPTENYDVNVEDENELYATDGFDIAITLIAIDPIEAPTGTAVSIIGYGFTGTNVNVTLGTTLVLEDISIADLEDGTTFIVPTLPIDTYTVTAEDSDSLIYSVPFDVNATTELILTPESAPAEYDVTIVGDHFSESSSVDIVLYNETDTYWEATVSTTEYGNFTTIFGVPELDLGDYFINVTDSAEFPGELCLINLLEVPFSVIEPYLEIHTISTEYDPEDIVRFYVNSTFDFDMRIDIDDPLGYPFTPITCTTDDWFKMDDYYVIPYAAYCELPSDATLGTWNWTAIDTIPDVKVANGTFTVGEILPDMGALSISTIPVDGEVFVDGMSWGIAPQSQEVEAGSYTVSFGAVAGYTTPDSVEATIVADTTEEVLGTYVFVPINEITLSTGWNLVSLPLIPTDSSIESVLAGVEGIESVWTYDVGVWYSYSPGAPSDLTNMVDGKGYWISMSASATLAVDGTEMPVDPFDPLPAYPVVEGYNLMGFKSTTPMTVSDYLLGVDYVRVYEYVDGYNALSAGEDMTPGRGYWISVFEAGTIYP